MGLLDALQGFGNNPAAVQGLLATGLGMLASNRAGVTTGQAIGQGGLLGMNAYANAQAAQQKAAQDAMQQQLWQQQIESGKVDEQTKQLALAQARQRMGFINQLLGGGTLGGDTSGTGDTGAAPAPAPAADVGGVPLGGTGDTSGAAATSGTAPGVPPILAAPAGAAAPAAPDAGAGIGGATAAALNAPTLAAQAAAQPAVAAAQQVGAPQHVTAAASMIPPQLQKAAAADLMFNDGKNMGTMLKPNISMQSNGALLDQSTGQIVGWAPVVDSGTGRAYMMQNGPDGKPALLPVAGSAENQRSIEQTKADVAANAGYSEINDPANPGQKIRVSNQWLNQHPGIVTQASPVDISSMTDVNKDFITNDYRPAIDAAKGAADDLGQIAAMRVIDPSTGWGADAKAKAAAVLTSLHVAPDSVQEYASNAQKFANVAMSKLQQNLALQKGPQTEGDAQRASKTFASLENTPQANAFILDYAQAQAEMKQRQADYLQQALVIAQQNHIPFNQVMQNWRKVQGSIWDNPVMSKWAPKKQGQ